MKKKTGVLLLTLLAVAAWFVIDKGLMPSQNIFINEVRSWDAAAERTGYFGSDYIELYNSSAEEISLHGWYLSDDAADLKKCQIYDVTIDAGDYVLLFANGNHDSGDSLNFKINPDGEKIFLSDAQGNLVDKVLVPKQEFGTVYARTTDGGKEWAVMEESTLASNNGCKLIPAKSLTVPSFSHESGFYEEAFTLTLSAEPGEIIYYTLDGSIPSEESSIYSEGILIKDRSGEPNVLGSVRNVVKDWENYHPDGGLVAKGVVVRAMTKNANGEVSEVATKTYFVDLGSYQSQTVVSVVADFDDMFGDNGIFVTGKDFDEGNAPVPNFYQSGRRWEIQGNMELLEEGECTLNQEIGIRTQGASTRDANKKKMSLFARREYSGSPYFEGWSLGEKQTHSVYTNHAISNVVFQELLTDRAVDLQSAEECAVFLNGEYWYSTYLMEKYNKHYLSGKYGVNPDNVIIIKDQSETEGPEDSYVQYLTLLDFAAMTDFSMPENYEELKNRIDVQSYIDFMCANIYLCNMDLSEIKNMMLWRTIEDEGTEVGDTRWRWMIYDVDCLEWVNHSFYDAPSRAAINTFTETMQFTGVSIREHRIYASAKANPEFQRQFVTTFLDIANVNFAPEAVEEVFAKWEETPEEKFGDFFETRFDHIVPYMAEEFELTGTLETVTLKVNDVQGGTILLNTTAPDLSDGSWMGRYYTDYPVTVTAVPKEGYEFSGWTGSVTSDSATIEAEVVAGGIALEAIFTKTGN